MGDKKRSSLYTNLAHEFPDTSKTTSTYKEYGKDFGKQNGETIQTVCTECKKVQLRSPAISIRLSHEDEDQWISTDVLSDELRTSHGLCRTCFNNMDAVLDLSPLSLAPLAPRRRSILSTSFNSPHLTQPLPPRPASPRVLVVDDNRLQRQIHKRMVEQEGYECEVAESGAEAVELTKKGTFSLVLMDLVMAPMDGYTTAKTIRRRHPPSSPLFSTSPKIVAVTGLRVDEKLRQECDRVGMDDVVQKPVSPAILSRLLQKHTKQQPIDR